MEKSFTGIHSAIFSVYDENMNDGDGGINYGNNRYS